MCFIHGPCFCDVFPNVRNCVKAGRMFSLCCVDWDATSQLNWTLQPEVSLRVSGGLFSSAEVTLNDGLVREFPQYALNSGLH